MRSRAPLALMEQMVMLLVFALAAAVCLQGFVQADRLSRRSEERDQAVLLAQSAAETLRQRRGLSDGPAYYDRDWKPCTPEQAVYVLTAEPEDSGVDGLGRAVIRVDGEETLFELRVCWQEGGDGA